jgi:cytochrome P450
MNAALYELLAHPAEYKKVQEELADALDEGNLSPTFAQVENLPYLNAVIQETMRLHPGVVFRQVRISPEEPIVYHDRRRDKTFVVPSGMAHSMSTRAMQYNPDVFGDNYYDFQPQRWINDPKLNRAFIAFARGTRNCIGLVTLFL